MKAADFYQHFEDSFNTQKLPPALKKMTSKTPKWKIQIDNGSLEFNLSTNFKGAGLLDHLLWPGEHRMHVYWITGRGKEKKKAWVSLFQYTTESEVASFTAITQGALKKYLNAQGPDPYGTLRKYSTSDLAAPKPNVDTFYYYFDTEDAQLWGAWYGSLLISWVSRFLANPESNDDWACRVMWPHLERPK